MLRRAADLISDRSDELAALMSMEVGKNRLEALGDVEESADFIRYYCTQIEDNDGFDRPMDRLSDAEITSSVLRPYGVWGVISAVQLPDGAGRRADRGCAGGRQHRAAQAEPAGLVLARPSCTSACCEAGLPADAVHLLPGGDEVGKALVAHPGVDGLTFTGSYEVGMQIDRSFAHRLPEANHREMGGKNPTVVVPARPIWTAAALGVARSAFGFSGQKCSACSRVYVEREVYDAVPGRADRAGPGAGGRRPDRAQRVLRRPVIDAAAVQRFADAVAHARKHGRVVAGGEAAPDGEGRRRGPLPRPDRGRRPADRRPAVHATSCSCRSSRWRPVDSLDEAMTLANGTDLGLTAGFFSADDAEVERFLDTHRGRRGVRQPRRPAPRPVPGPGCSPSVAGRAPAAPARPAAACTTSSNTCASSPERW